MEAWRQQIINSLDIIESIIFLTEKEIQTDPASYIEKNLHRVTMPSRGTRYLLHYSNNQVFEDHVQYCVNCDNHVQYHVRTVTIMFSIV